MSEMRLYDTAGNRLYLDGEERAAFLTAARRRPARHLIAAWRDDYNHRRPHSSLDGLTPREYHQRSREDQTLNGANL